MDTTEPQHHDGVPWWEARTPWWVHRCRTQSSGVIDGHMVERCPCGAIRIDLAHWLNKNETRMGRLRRKLRRGS